MIKPYIRIASLLTLVALGAVSHAYAKQERVLVTNEHSGVAVTIPENARQVSENVWSLGTSIDPEHGDVVEGYMIVHRKDAYKKPSGTPGGGGSGSDTTSTCYTFLASGAKWKTVEPWIVNPTNNSNIPGQTVFNILSEGIEKWEDAAGNPNIIGEGSTTTVPLEADSSSMDGVNEVFFDALDSGTIGVTIVWGIFGGPPRGRELREWDQVYNTYYSWSAETSGVGGKMDFDNIATHELGHTFGLGDLYTTSCTDETMYGYGGYAQTDKRTLNAGDIAGISSLY